MDSYIVRVYRRGLGKGKEIAGLVERVGSNARKAFGTSDELWTFLAEPSGKPEIPERKRKNRGT